MLGEESIFKAAFTTPFGHFEPLRMLFGLKNAPKTFQKLIWKVVSGYINKFVKCFLDDILIYSKTLEEHLHHLELVFERLNDAGLTINIEKSNFAKRQVEYLGHMVGETGISKKPETVRAIKEFPTPTDKKSVQSFVGLCQWYAYFIPNFATKSGPLYETIKMKEFSWGPEQEAAFQNLKREMCEDVALASIDYEKPIVLKTDASQIGCGAVLVNRIDGRDRPIAFISKRFKKSEINARIYEKEAFAIIWAYRKLKDFLWGHKFSIQTDCRAVQFIKNMKDKKPKISRWALEMSSWDAEIILVKGSVNVEADALSRVLQFHLWQRKLHGLTNHQKWYMLQSLHCSTTN